MPNIQLSATKRETLLRHLNKSTELQHLDNYDIVLHTWYDSLEVEDVSLNDIEYLIKKLRAFVDDVKSSKHTTLRWISQ